MITSSSPLQNNPPPVCTASILYFYLILFNSPLMGFWVLHLKVCGNYRNEEWIYYHNFPSFSLFSSAFLETYRFVDWASDRLWWWCNSCGKLLKKLFHAVLLFCYKLVWYSYYNISFIKPILLELRFPLLMATHSLILQSEWI